MAEYLIADTETTGVKFYDRVVEVAWLVCDESFAVLDRGYSLINPQKVIPDTASEIHGITNADVADSPTIEEYFNEHLGGELAQKDLIFTAHNSRFDYQFLNRFLFDGTPQMCTLKLARKIYPTTTNHKLGTLIKELAIDIGREDFHSAEADVLAVHALLQRMAADTGRTAWDLFEYANEPVQHTTMPFGKHKGLPLDRVPKEYVSWYLNKAQDQDPDLVQCFRNLGY